MQILDGINLGLGRSSWSHRIIIGMDCHGGGMFSTLCLVLGELGTINSEDGIGSAIIGSLLRRCIGTERKRERKKERRRFRVFGQLLCLIDTPKLLYLLYYCSTTTIKVWLRCEMWMGFFSRENFPIVNCGCGCGCGCGCDCDSVAERTLTFFFCPQLQVGVSRVSPIASGADAIRSDQARSGPD